MVRCRVPVLSLAALMLFVSIAMAGDSDAPSPLELVREHHTYGQPHPDAPAEISQFAFIIGDWSCTARFLGADGETYNEGTADWIGVYTLDGWAIQDYWVGHGPEGQEYHGTNIRSFDKESGKWNNRWLPAGTLRWKYYESEQIGDTMVMTGGEGSDSNGDFIDRNTFYEIGADSWRWRKDRSYDGGKTWLEGVGFIEATRKK